MADYFFDTSALVKRHVNDAARAEGLTVDDPHAHP
jgi:hypothetical protein